jgi:hypothetical protein
MYGVSGCISFPSLFCSIVIPLEGYPLVFFSFLYLALFCAMVIFSHHSAHSSFSFPLLSRFSSMGLARVVRLGVHWFPSLPCFCLRLLESYRLLERSCSGIFFFESVVESRAVWRATGFPVVPFSPSTTPCFLGLSFNSFLLL